MVSWARRVNGRWIVHHSLRERAEDYLDYLAQGDPGRLQASCENAKTLVRTGAGREDPKPWFYAGLFSLATAEERRRYLTEHRFTTAILAPADEEKHRAQGAPGFSPSTEAKLERIRQAVAHLMSGGAERC